MSRFTPYTDELHERDNSPLMSVSTVFFLEQRLCLSWSAGNKSWMSEPRDSMKCYVTDLHHMLIMSRSFMYSVQWAYNIDNLIPKKYFHFASFPSWQLDFYSCINRGYIDQGFQKRLFQYGWMKDVANFLFHSNSHIYK